jgi:hypothetical protein
MVVRGSVDLIPSPCGNFYLMLHDLVIDIVLLNNLQIDSDIDMSRWKINVREY